MSISTPLLELKDFSAGFYSGRKIQWVTENISLKIHRTETLGILGESGSGKSVTALSVLRLLPEKNVSLKGSVLFETENNRVVDLLTLKEEEIRLLRGNRISMIFQEPMTSLNPVMTCGRQVAEAILTHNRIGRADAKEQVIHWFNEVQLPRPEKLYDSYPHQLSGGQRQRVMIAMAMSCRPDLLIADEPTTALDVTVQKTILDLLKSLQIRFNMSIMFITHDIGVLSQIADRISVFRKGKIVEEDSTRNILHFPKHPYTKGLLACRPPLDKRPQRLITVRDYINIPTEEKAPEIKYITSSAREEMHQLIYSREPELVIRNLNTWYTTGRGFSGKATGFIKAVNDLNLEVYKGETLGLVGESGCGKTTLGRTILRLVEAGSGDIFFRGLELSKLKKSELRRLRQKMQLIFQDPYSSLNPRMTIGEAIMEPMRVHKKSFNNAELKNQVIGLLEKTDLDDSFYFRYPHELSGGQRQRAVIARALATGPEFIICDEPVSALDVSIQAQVLNLLNDLKDSFGLTYIFISHDLSVIRYMSDRIVVMKNGRIEETGDADELCENPVSSYTRTLIGSIPVIE
ncbi:MAG: ABC transporter ATP-binding protein [Bacteroidia bacterium]|nr:ABC transporter ATP-binding protein [Bacteroidia bacterium]